MSDVFIDIVIDHILFFALCTDEQCNPDTAVKQLESIAGTLKLEGTREDRRQFFARVDARLANEKHPAIRQELASLRESIGFDD